LNSHRSSTARGGTRLITALLLAGAAWPSAAQTTLPAGIPSQADISRQRVPQPLPETPSFDLRIQTPERAAVPRAVDEIEFEVKRLTVEGATPFPADEIAAIFAPLEGRRIFLDDLRKAAATLEARYRTQGFFLTRVFVPPQQVKDGVLTVRVVEGYVSNVFVEAPDAATRERLARLLQPIVGQKPVSLEAVERRLLIVNDLPGITGTGVLRQGAELGQSELALNVAERPSSYSVSFNNSGSSALGPWTIGANATLNQPFARIGALDLGITGAGEKLKELRSLTARYAEPIGHSGTIVSLGGLVAMAKPGGPVKALDIDGLVTSFALRARHPLIRTRATSLFIDAGLSANRSRTEAADTRIILDKTVVGELALVFQHSGWLGGATNVAASLFHGLPGLGSMDEDADLPSVANFDPDFTRLAFSAQHVQPLIQRLSLQLSAQGQYTRDTLLSGELLSFGGMSIGRGYDPSVVAGDRGLGGVAELRYDLALPSQAVANSLQLYTFVDRASVTTLKNGPPPKSKATIGSYGCGPRLGLFDKAYLDLRLADATREVDDASPQRDPRVTVMGVIAF